MGGSAGCSVVEEHHRVRIESESETRITNQMAWKQHNLDQHRKKTQKDTKRPCLLLASTSNTRGPTGPPKTILSATIMRGIISTVTYYLLP